MPLTVQNLKALIDETPGVLLLFFERPGDTAMKWFRPTLETLQQQNPAIAMVGVDLLHHPRLRERFKVGHLPHLSLIRGGCEIAMLRGIYTLPFLQQWLMQTRENCRSRTTNAPTR